MLLASLYELLQRGYTFLSFLWMYLLQQVQRVLELDDSLMQWYKLYFLWIQMIYHYVLEGVFAVVHVE